MNFPQKSVTLLTSLSAPFVANAATIAGSEFDMPMNPSPDNISTNDFLSRTGLSDIPTVNLGVIVDPLGLGDADTPSGATAAWDLDQIVVAYDRIDKTLWFGMEVGAQNGTDPVDFGTPDAGDLGDFAFTEFVTGAIDLDNDNVFDVWFGIYQEGSGSNFSSAIYLDDGVTSTNKDYAANGDGSPASPLGLETATPWITADTVGGGNSFGFMLDLDANPLTSQLLPNSSIEESVFNLQFDLGSISDNYGEDTVAGTVTFPAIPEPTSVTLLALSLGLSTIRRKR